MGVLNVQRCNISKLFFCDFTCNAYTPHGFSTLSKLEADEITELLVSTNVRGGNVRGGKTKTGNKKRKSQKKKKSHKNKK